MAETTKIQWTDHTFNPWRGCTKVHAGCTHCYAERDSKRNPGVLGVWGDMGTRVVAAEKTWGDPLKWNKAAEAAGERRRVFCASLADVFEDWGDGHVSGPDGRVWVKPYLDSESQPENWQLEDEETMRRDSQGWRFVTLHDVRARLFALIDATPWLDWQLLTKRPENVRRMWPSFTLLPPNVRVEHALNHPHADIPDSTSPSPRRPNVWIGTSVSDQETADKYVPELLKLRDLTPVLFLSMEPLLGPVRLCDLHREHEDGAGYDWISHAGIDWVIVGGESGAKARWLHMDWVWSILSQCREADVPLFVKQLGQCPRLNNQDGDRFPGVRSIPSQFAEPEMLTRILLNDKKGGDPAEWPEDVRVRQFPRVERIGA